MNSLFEREQINVFDIVKVKDDAISCYTVAARKKFSQRIGTVERLFIPLGSRTQYAMVLWKKRGSRGKEFHDSFNVRDLEVVLSAAEDSSVDMVDGRKESK